MLAVLTNNQEKLKLEFFFLKYVLKIFTRALSSAESKLLPVVLKSQHLFSKTRSRIKWLTVEGFSKISFKTTRLSLNNRKKIMFS